MKNILIIQGGRKVKGNTVQLIGNFVKSAKEAGHYTAGRQNLQ